MDKKKILSHILASLKAHGADDAETMLSDSVKTEIYYEQKKIGMIRTNFDYSLIITAIMDKKKGTVRTNSIDEKSVEKAISDVIEAMKSSIADEDVGIADEVVQKSFSKGVRTGDKEALYSLLKGFIGDAEKEYPSISFDSVTAEHDAAETLYMNTNGVELTSENGYYVFSPMFMARDGDVSSSFNYLDVAFTDTTKPLISTGCARRTLAATEKQIHTKPLDGKFVGDVIMTPAFVDDIFGTIEGLFLSDTSIINGTSPFKDSLGKKVADEKLTLYCAPLCKELVAGYSLTGDGYVAEDMPLFENGVLKNFVLSRYGAAKAKRTRSKNSGGCFVMNAGTVNYEDMIKGVKRGILVDRFSGGEPTADGLFSGVAKNSFLIEDGKITDALSETMISGSLTEMLNSIKEISVERDNNGSRILPWIKVDGITVSGK